MQSTYSSALLVVTLLGAPVFAAAQDTIQIRDTIKMSTAVAVDPADSAKKLAKVMVKAAKPQVGYVARRSYSATRTDMPLLDVPQSVSIVAKELMADQAMQSMAEVVRYVPGVTMGQGEGHRDAPTIRGNSSTADFFVDGVRDDAQYLRDLYNVEQVEVLKGSNAMIFGRGGGGGVINRVSKEAAWQPLHSITLEGGAFDHKRATLDFGSALNKSLAGRFNGMVESSGHFRESSVIEREGVNPAVALLLGGTLVRAGYEYFADRRTVNRGIPSYRGRPSRADISTFFGDPDHSPSRTTVQSGGVLVEHGWANGLTLRNRSRFANYEKFYQNVYPGAVSSDGNAVDILAYNSTIDRRNVFTQSDVSFAVATGAIRHSLLIGADYGHQGTDNFRSTGYFNNTATTFSAPFSAPNVRVPVTYRQSASDADNHVDLNVAAAFVQNQLSFGPYWQGIVGLRYERFALDFRNHRNNESLWREDLAFSPRAGLVFKPVPSMSAYGTYSVSYLPASGDQFGSLNATTQTLKPEGFANKEGGLKWEVRPDFVVNGSVYRLDRTNTSAPAADNPARIVQTGHQRSTGVELGASGNVTRAWQMAAAFATQRALILSTTSAAKAGVSVPLVPKTMVSLWNRYQFMPRLGAGIGVVHQTDVYAAIDNKVTLPGYTRLDAAAFLKITRSARAQINIENLLDTRYFATSHGNNNIMPGAPRMVRVSITATP